MYVIDFLPGVIGAAAVLPALLLWLVVAADGRPPPGRVWTAFVMRAASIFLLRYLRLPLAPLIGDSANAWVRTRCAASAIVT